MWVIFASVLVSAVHRHLFNWSPSDDVLDRARLGLIGGRVRSARAETFYLLSRRVMKRLH